MFPYAKEFFRQRSANWSPALKNSLKLSQAEKVERILVWRDAKLLACPGAPTYLGSTLYEVCTDHWFNGLNYSTNCESCLGSFRKHLLCAKTFSPEALKGLVSWTSPPEAVHIYGDAQVGPRVIWTCVNCRRKRQQIIKIFVVSFQQPLLIMATSSPLYCVQICPPLRDRPNSHQ